jgi:hypothetical protein
MTVLIVSISYLVFLIGARYADHKDTKVIWEFELVSLFELAKKVSTKKY